MSKKYKAIFFDWDGTAVMSRQAPVEEAVAAMKPLLASGVKLVIVSGTTYDHTKSYAGASVGITRMLERIIAPIKAITQPVTFPAHLYFCSIQIANAATTTNIANNAHVLSALINVFI